MADFDRGIKAGMATGLVYIVIAWILGAIYQNNPSSVPDFIYGTGLAPLFILGEFADPSFVFSFHFQYVIRGIIFGAVFAVLYDYLPGVTSIVKGVVLSASLCIVALVGAIYTTLGWPWPGIIHTGIYYSGTVNLSSISLALASIMSALIFGTLTGSLRDRFRGKVLTEERKGRSILLVSFIMGGIIWALGAAMLLLAVGIGRGIPAIDPESWWSDLLNTSVVFLGLPGWVLTLVAWKKTKVDKSGLKWGVAGGVIMALTGIMLLPGVLAIIGGALSRRKPATESSTAAIGQLQ